MEFATEHERKRVELQTQGSLNLLYIYRHEAMKHHP